MAADFPTNLWIREPVIDGRVVPGGGLTRAMALLSQARDEITAIETKLGTNVHGTATDLAARLAVHHSPSGIRRGNVRALRGPNTVGGAKATIEDWWIGGTTYIQAGLTSFNTTGIQTAFFPSAYFAGNPPQYIIAKFAEPATVTNFCGSVQVLYDSITVSQFQLYAKKMKAGGLWQDAGTGGVTYDVHWLAFGGAPA